MLVRQFRFRSIILSFTPIKTTTILTPLYCPFIAFFRPVTRSNRTRTPSPCPSAHAPDERANVDGDSIGNTTSIPSTTILLASALASAQAAAPIYWGDTTNTTVTNSNRQALGVPLMVSSKSMQQSKSSKEKSNQSNHKSKDKRRGTAAAAAAVAKNTSSTSIKAEKGGPFALALAAASAEPLPMPSLRSAMFASLSSSSSSLLPRSSPSSSSTQHAMMTNATVQSSSPCHSMINEGVSLPLGMFSVQGPMRGMPVLPLPGQWLSAQGPRLSAQGPGLSAPGPGLSAPGPGLNSPVYLNAGEIRARIEERRVQGTGCGKKHTREEMEPDYNCARFSSISCMASMGNGFLTLDTQLEKRRKLISSSSSTVTSPSHSL